MYTHTHTHTTVHTTVPWSAFVSHTPVLADYSQVVVIALLRTPVLAQVVPLQMTAGLCVYVCVYVFLGGGCCPG